MAPVDGAVLRDARRLPPQAPVVITGLIARDATRVSSASSNGFVR
jgi:hypothetical protein